MNETDRFIASLLSHVLLLRSVRRCLLVRLLHLLVAEFGIDAPVVELTVNLARGAVEAATVSQAIAARAGREAELLAQARSVAT